MKQITLNRLGTPNIESVNALILLLKTYVPASKLETVYGATAKDGSLGYSLFNAVVIEALEQA